MNLIKKFNQSPYAFFFLNIDKFLDINFDSLNNFITIYAFNNSNTSKLKNKNKDYFCLEENGQKLKIKNSAYLLKQEKVINFIKSIAQNKQLTPVIIPFKPSSKIEHICQKNHWIYAAIPAKLNRFLEDKINFNKLCQENNLPTIPTKIDTFNQQNFQKYQQSLSPKLVLQNRYGWAGKQTFLANKWIDIKDKIIPGTSVKYSPFMTGYSLTNNCSLTKKGLIQSPPALQYNNIPSLSNNPFTTVGRQWPAFASTEINEKVKELTNSFSQILINLDYKGFFGLDFLVNQNRLLLLECNPRLTASVDLYSQIEIKNKINPLFLFHLAEFIQLDLDINIKIEQKRFYNTDLIGSEITKKNSQNNTIARYQNFIPFSPQNNPIEINPQIIQRIDERK